MVQAQILLTNVYICDYVSTLLIFEYVLERYHYFY